MTYRFIETQEELNGLCHVIKDYKGVIGADIETTGLDWMLDKILLFQLYIGDTPYVVDVRKLGYENLTRLVGFLQSSNNTLIFHNGKFDIKFIYYATKILLTHLYDTMICEILLHIGKDDMYFGLVKLVEKYTDYFMDKETRNEFINFPDDKPFTESMLVYSAFDVKVLPAVMTEQYKEIQATHQEKIASLENSVIPVVAKMEIDGIRLDTVAWLDVLEKAKARRNSLTRELNEMVADYAINKLKKVSNGLELSEKLKIPIKRGGKAARKALEDITDISYMRGWIVENFNPKSPTQMLNIINLMGIKVKNTNEKTIDKHAGKPIVDQLLLIREVNKQIDSYGLNVIELIHPITGKIHTEFNTIGTQTGRFSSIRPNMQNVPRHGGYRECFIPDEGYVFIAVDYSQQEYRLAGAVSRDRRIIEAYKNGSDMHTATAQAQFGKTEITKDERTLAKTLNFAILYGSTEFGLQRNLMIPLDKAKEMLNKFWDGYPQLSQFMKLVGEKILELGFSSTPMGRRRYNVPKPTFMDSRQFVKWQERILREGKNHIIQGGGADIMKIAMVEIFNRNPFGDYLKLCLQVHDELVVQAHKSVMKEVGLFVRDVMEEVEQRFLGEIPAKADGWDEFKERWSK